MMRKILFIIIGCFLVGCQLTTSKYPTSVEQSHDALRDAWVHDNYLSCHKPVLPSEVRNALLPRLALQQPKGVKNPNQFNVAAKDVPAKSFFMGLVEGTPYNMIIDPKVSGTITLNMQSVTLDE